MISQPELVKKLIADLNKVSYAKIPNIKITGVGSLQYYEGGMLSRCNFRTT